MISRIILILILIIHDYYYYYYYYYYLTSRLRLLDQVIFPNHVTLGELTDSHKFLVRLVVFVNNYFP